MKSLAIYGHNSHGKGNFLKSYELFLKLISTSFTQTKQSIPIEPFLLNTANHQKPSSFEISFLIRETKYRYGFEVTAKNVVSEWLFYSEAGVKENFLFVRNAQDFQISKTWNKELNIKHEIHSVPFAKPTILFLSVLISQDNPKISPIGRWLQQNIILSNLDNDNILSTATEIFSNLEYRDLILRFIENADLGFTTIFDKIVANIQKNNKYEKGFLV